jgi:hypothetical protein
VALPPAAAPNDSATPIDKRMAERRNISDPPKLHMQRP